MSEISAANLDDAKKIVAGKPLQVGTDRSTGEAIVRQRFFVFENLPDGGLPEDIDTMINMLSTALNAAITARQPWVAAPLMLMLAENYSQRANPATLKTSSDRTKAKETLGLLMALNERNIVIRMPLLKEYGISEEKMTLDAKKAFAKEIVDDPAIYIAQAKLAVAELVIKQMNDNDPPAFGITKVIEYCTQARQVISGMEGKRKDYNALSKSYVLEAKLRILRNNRTLDTDEAIIGLLEAGKASVGITGTLLDKVASDKLLAQIKKDMEGNEYIGGANRLYKNLTPEQSVQKALEGDEYNAASADIEEVKLLTSKVTITEAEKPAFIAKLENAILKCQNAKAFCDRIKKPYDYLNSDAAVTEADLTAKLGRLLKEDRVSTLTRARDLYAAIAENPIYKFNDVKARGIIGRYSIDIELGEFDWGKVNEVLVNYFDPSSGINNVKYPFNAYTYTFMSALHLECQLRNVAKRSKVSVPGCPTCEDKVAGKKADYDLAASRAMYVSDNITKILYLRDPDAVYDLLARVTVDEAQATASKSMKLQDPIAKTEIFNAANKILDRLFAPPAPAKPILAGETPANIEANPVDRKMEVSFYVSAWAEEAGNLAQVAWQTNSNLQKKNTGLFDTAIQGYQAAIIMCDKSLSSYDKVDRKVNMELAISKIELLGAVPLEFKLNSPAEVTSALSALDSYVGKVDDSIKAAESRTYPAGFSATNKAKFIAGLKRLKFEAICQKIYFINKQTAGNVSFVRNDEITRLYNEAKTIANGILPVMDVTYYTVLDLFGISSVYLGIDPNAAVETIMICYDNYVKGRDFEITYDMMDALANAAAINKNKVLKTAVLDKLQELILNSVTPDVSKAKAYVWKARINTWFYDENDPDGAALFQGVMDDYSEALKIYGAVTGDAQKLYENGVSHMMVQAEYADAAFRHANIAFKGEANDALRVAEYQRIAGIIRNDIIGRSTNIAGLTPVTVEKTGKQDKAADIRARLTLKSIIMGLSEPLARKSITAQTVSAICGSAVNAVNTTYTVAETMFKQIVEDMGTLGLTDTELTDLGIDVLDVYTSMAENYMILALNSRDADQRTDFFKKFSQVVTEGIAKAGTLHGDDEKKGNTAKGKLTILMANMYFWKTQSIKEAVSTYADGFALITGLNIRQIKDGGFANIPLKDLASYADAVAIAAMKMPTETPEEKVAKEKAKDNADSILDIVIARDTNLSIFGANAHMRKGDLVLGTTVDLTDNDRELAAMRTRLGGSVTELATALSQANQIDNGTDINAQLISFEHAEKLNKNLMGMLCRLMEARVRSYNKKSKEDRITVWKAEYELINRARNIVQTYLIQEYRNICYENIPSGAEDITKIGTTIKDQLIATPATEDIGSILRRVPQWRAVLIQSGAKMEVPEAKRLFEEATDFDTADLP